MSSISYLVFDFETSGLDRNTDRIIQVGLHAVRPQEPAIRESWLVNQDCRIDPEAALRHKLTIDRLRSHGIPPEESLRRLLDRLGGAKVCIGHNIHRFDVPFLLAECRRFNVTPPETRDYIDTAAHYKGWKLNMKQLAGETQKAFADRVLELRVKGLKYAIPECVRDLKIKAEGGALHDAAHDTYLTYLIFEALRGKGIVECHQATLFETRPSLRAGVRAEESRT